MRKCLGSVFLDKEKKLYISNVNVYCFSKIYRDVGFTLKNGSLKNLVQFSEAELQKFDKDIIKNKTVDEPLENQITD